MKFEFEEPAFNPDEPLGYLEGGVYMPRSIKVHHLNARLAALKDKANLSPVEAKELDLIESIFNSIEVCILLGEGDELTKLDINLIHQDSLVDKLKGGLIEPLPPYLVIDWASTAKSYAMQNSIGRVEIAGTPYYFD